MAEAGTPAGTAPAGTPAGSTEPITQPAGAAPAGAPPAADPAPGATPPAGVPGTPQEPAGGWPEDWRSKMAGGDDKALKRLERYASPKAAIDALFSVQSKISAGELRSALKENATPEEVAQWRTDNGIPEAPEGYELKTEVSELDRPLVDEFLKVAHTKNMHPSAVNDVVQWFLDTQDRGAAELAARDKQDEIAVHSELRVEMGPEYKVNLQMALEVLPKDITDDLLAARLPDGKALGNDLRVIRWLANIAREINPVAAAVPGSGVNASQAVESEIANLRKMMGDRTSEYWRGPQATKYQSRYRDLLSAQQRAGR